MADRRRWSEVKRSRRNSAARRRGYRTAQDTFGLAERIRSAREKLGITQAQLAARIGSTQPAVARLEAGGVSPSLDTLHRVAEALGLELVVDFRPAKRASA